MAPASSGYLYRRAGSRFGALSRVSQFRVGQRVCDRFALLESLGRGAEGEVWRALDGRRSAQCAIKLIPTSDPNVEAVWRGFLRQHRISSRIDHPRVLRVFEPVRDAICLALPMALAAGDARSLRGKSWMLSIRVLRDVAEGLIALHSAGIVHRDLKPSNILIDFAGRAWISDWGSAALDGDIRGAAAGSPFSASPAQRRGEHPCAADDLYGLGAIAYELLGGYPPFFPDPPSPISTTAVPALIPVRPVPPALQQSVMSLLAVDAAARPADAAEVACMWRELVTELTETPIAAVVRMPETVVEQRLEGTTAATWMTLVMLGILLIGVFVVLPRFATPIELSRSAAAPSKVLLTEDPELEARRQAYLEIAQRYTDLLESLESRAAGVWGGADLAAAKTLGERGLAAAEQRDIVLGRDRLEVAVQRLGRLESQLPRIVEARLAAGLTAIDAGRLELARSELSVVLQADPGNVVATSAMERLEALQPLLPTLVAAEAALLAGKFLAALEGFEQVLRADAENKIALAGLARAKRAIGSDRYARAIGEALAAARMNRLETSRAALAIARTERPQAAEILGVEQQLIAAGERLNLEGFKEEILELERSERWADALARYDALLAQQPSLRFAQQGRARVIPRLLLVERLDGLLARPDRLASPEVRREAEGLLIEAGNVESSFVRTQDSASRLRQMLALYDLSVSTVLQSDGVTEIVLQRRGSLGTLTRREMLLKPGRYVFVGRRVGFRDVRREVFITPQSAGTVIDVRCSETAI